MNIYKTYLFSLLTSFAILSCSSDSEDFKNIEENQETATTTPETQPEDKLEVENFIYRGMNDIYLYKAHVPALADDYFESEEEKINFLENFSSPSNLFERLMADQDRFSYLIEDYREMNKMSTNKTGTGMEFGLSAYGSDGTDVFGFVKLVLPNSSAAAKGVERGMIFTRINGTSLTSSNFRSLASLSNFSIGLAEIDGNQIRELDRTISLNTGAFSANPVGEAKILNVSGRKVGYLYYDSFDQDFDEELNAAFSTFKGAGVSDLVLDLRYNGGGSVRTATDLAAMITGQFANQVFMIEEWNEKYQTHFEQNDPERLKNNFNTQIRTGTGINSLNLNRVFVLTTKETASASELIINGLNPYIDVIHIGDVTTGKFQASVAIYDSPDFSKDSNGLNTNHHYAMQPLVLKSSNKNNVSDFVNGLNPDHELPEDVTNLGVLGDPNEPLLKLAIDIIQGNRSSVPNVKTYTRVGNSKMFEPEYQKMYIDNKDLPVIK
ncbi:S41 family peptidase [Gillisia limnaea]|uniref:Peptidase S41 n=1 Tax=Gillisia limnaea (strain DSM 15749 / LMG 21470 / R-8282) TaxID=865937 RepID=H2BWV4_GILLR|nr:S41 family peptidase [Gillisia limnaea]EHQ04127.1 peptidase S41 [Gillisia limnaea DSM 15749]